MYHHSQIRAELMSAPILQIKLINVLILANLDKCIIIGTMYITFYKPLESGTLFEGLTISSNVPW